MSDFQDDPNDTPQGDLQDDHSTSFVDVKQLGLVASVASLSYVFWVCGAMEMVERLAFYGVKAVSTLYAKAPAVEGGLGVDLTQFGTLLAVWAAVQSFLPIFTGGLSDRYGYKITIFLSTVIKIIGYLIMAWSAIYANDLSWLSAYWGFFAGAIVLAIGTAVFKPGIQGTVVLSTNRRNSSMAWGVFYQTVNIGGYLGPLVAGLMRERMQTFVDSVSWLDSGWPLVFLACAIIIALNFILLLTYKEVGKEERLERRRLIAEGKLAKSNLAAESIRELLKPHVWTYLLLFSGFWFMFMALFDVLPAHIDDWVNTSDIIQTLFHGGKSENAIVNFFVITNEEGTAIQPEGMLNLNAMLIMITCFFFAWISSKMRATTSMVVGTLFASAAMFASGYSTAGWVSVAAIGIFSIGEMLSSPKFSEFIGNFAPKGKKAMYLGFSQVPIAIGWTLEGKLGPTLYDIFASKDRFSREVLMNRINDGKAVLPNTETLSTWAENVNRQTTDSADQFTPDVLSALCDSDPQAFVDVIPNGEAFNWLVTMTGENAQTLTAWMHGNYETIGYVWYVLGGIGIISAIGIAIYGKWILTLRKQD
ncbi:MAG: MFS transporter [Phycisphaerales bacterium]|nr:MFS transporter [Phycisphaerales bacterium]